MGTPIKGRRGRPTAASAPRMDLNTIATPTPQVTPSQPDRAGSSRTKTPKSSQTQKNKTPRKRGIDDSIIAPPLIGASITGRVPVIDLTGDAPSQPKKAKKVKKATGDDGSGTKNQFESTWKEPERRLRKWRDHPPQSYLERLDRIRSTRMFVVGHEVGGTEEVPRISFDVVGSTGNLYKATIDQRPHCDCPDGMKGNQCKHICYVLLHALKAPAHLQYQLAFISSELREILQGSSLALARAAPSTEDNNGNRKPIEGDCPICFQEMIGDKESIVWCQAACGNNVHKQCFAQWAAASSTGSGERSQVRCVYCRSPWKTDTPNVDVTSLRQDVKNVGPEGYVNLASEFGLSGERDWSVYSPFSSAPPLSSSWFHRRRYWD